MALGKPHVFERLVDADCLGLRVYIRSNKKHQYHEIGVNDPDDDKLKIRPLFRWKIQDGDEIADHNTLNMITREVMCGETTTALSAMEKVKEVWTRRIWTGNKDI
jgi:hypothetical protein